MQLKLIVQNEVTCLQACLIAQSDKGPARTRRVQADSNLVLPQTGNHHKGLGQSEGALLETPFNTTGVVRSSVFLPRIACASRVRELRLPLSRRVGRGQYIDVREAIKSDRRKHKRYRNQQYTAALRGYIGALSRAVP